MGIIGDIDGMNNHLGFFLLLLLIFQANFLAGQDKRFKRVIENANYQDSVFKERVEFSFTKFSGDAAFVVAQFDSLADFSNAKFDEKTIFDGCTFTGKVDFTRAIFNGFARFIRVNLPDTFILDYVRAKEVFDLSDTVNETGETCWLSVIGTDISKLKLNYLRFQLLFRGDTTTNQVRKNIYENLLKSQEQFPDGYKKLDIEYKQFKYDQAGWWGGLQNFLIAGGGTMAITRRRSYRIPCISSSYCRSSIG